MPGRLRVAGRGIGLRAPVAGGRVRLVVRAGGGAGGQAVVAREFDDPFRAALPPRARGVGGRGDAPDFVVLEAGAGQVLVTVGVGDREDAGRVAGVRALEGACEGGGGVKLKHVPGDTTGVGSLVLLFCGGRSGMHQKGRGLTGGSRSGWTGGW